MDAGHFCHLISDREDGIQSRHRLLENHRDAIATDLTHFVVRKSDEILPFELDAASGFNATGRLDQSQYRKRSDGFSAPRFADDADGLSLSDLE